MLRDIATCQFDSTFDNYKHYELARSGAEF